MQSESQESQPEEITVEMIQERAKAMDDLFDEMSDIVTKYGPTYLIRGMSLLEAHKAIMACIKGLIAENKRLIHNIKEMTPAELGDKILQLELPHA